MKKLLLNLFLIFVFIFTSCSSNNDNNSLNTSVPHNDSTYNLVFVCPNVNNKDYWGKCVEGMKYASDELGATIEVIGPSIDASSNDEVWTTNFDTYLRQAIDMKPDGILAYSGLSSLNSLLIEAKNSNIPVIAIDSDAIDKNNRVAYVGTDEASLGIDACVAIADATTGTAKVGVLWHNKDSQNDQIIYNAFKEKASEYEIDIVCEKETGGSKAKAKEYAREMVREHPDLRGILAISSENTTGAGEYKMESGSGVYIVGFDDTKENLSLIKDGALNCIIVQQPYTMGSKGVRLMVQYLENKELINKEYHTLTMKVTKNNVDSYSDFTGAISSAIKQVKVGYYTKDEKITEDEIYAFQKIDAMTGRKTGYAYDFYQEIASFTGWKYEYELGEDYQTSFIKGSKKQMLELLEQGRIDILAGVTKEDANWDEDLQTGTFFLSDTPMLTYKNDEYYFAVNKERVDLLVELNNAINSINEENPFYISTLHQKYWITNRKVYLTEKEEQWLDAKQIITVGYLNNSLPISDTDSKGNPIGLLSDMIKLFEKYLSIKVKTKAYNESLKLKDALKNKEVDVIFPSVSDYWISEKNNYKITNSFFSDKLMVVYSDQHLGNSLDKILVSIASKSIAPGQREYLNYLYPNSDIVHCDTIEEGLELVRNKERKCFICPSFVLQRYINSTEFEGSLNISYLDVNIEFAMGINHDDTILVSVLNKFIKEVDRSIITGALVNYSAIEYNYGVEKVLRDNVSSIIVISLIFIVTLTIVFVLYVRKAKHFNVEQEKNRIELEKALAIADNANKAKTAFLSSMSHDIRTPMNAIVGMTSIATKRINDKEKVMYCLEKINVSSNHLLALINDVLDISKIESGKFILSPSIFSLPSLVFDLINIVRSSIHDKKIDFGFRIENINYDYLEADVIRLNQIYINLLSNAIKYTPMGGSVKIEISERDFDNNSVLLVYKIEDTGIGMSKEFIDGMYEKFSRANDKRIDNIQGTGLGLAIVKQMVTLMNGTIECESELNKGTKFTVSIRVPVREDAFTRTALPNIRALLIDKDENVLLNFKKVLGDIDVESDMVSTQEDAINLIKENPNLYNIIIVDWNMPNVVITEFIEKMRELVPSKTKCLISSYEWEDINIKIPMNKVDGFIGKPIFRSTIHEKLVELFNIEIEEVKEEEHIEDELRGLNILVAEDNDLNWEVVSTILDMHGISSERAENGKVCVDKIIASEKDKYSLILMDARMPVMDGKEATKMIRSSEIDYVREIPIIAMTADVFAEDIAAYMEAGMDGYLFKPVDVNKLFQEVRRIMKKKSGGGLNNNSLVIINTKLDEEN